MIAALRETDTGNDVPVLNPRAWRRGDRGVFSSLSGLPISRVITMSLGELSFVLLHVRPERDRETASLAMVRCGNGWASARMAMI
jgi:hypothetical protein